MAKSINNIINLFIFNKMKQQIPTLLEMELNKVASQYSRSPATTNAGRILRFISRFITVDTVVKLFAHKLKK